MKKKFTTVICTALSAVFALAMLSGCDLITTDNEKDMDQVVAEVNVSEETDLLTETFSIVNPDVELTSEVLSSMSAILSTDEVYKRDLVAYFVSYGYSYVSSGYSYEDTFELLIDALADRKIISQYATLYYLSNADGVVVDQDYIDGFSGTDVISGATDLGYEQVGSTDAYQMSKSVSVSGYLEAIDGLEGTEAQLAAYRYFLTDEEYEYCVYTVKSAINDSIDTYEETIIDADETETSDETRSIPTGANTLADYYYSDDYEIYTGINTADECGTYETVDGSTKATRLRAYARFISALKSNYLYEDGESISDPTSIEYFSTELKTQLEGLLISKFDSSLATQMSDKLEQSLLETAYQELLVTQQVTSETSFSSTMESVSDSSFIVYSPENKTYGFVTNLLLGFDTEQTAALADVQSRYDTSSGKYYAARTWLYDYIRGTDQRDPWFNGSTDYSFAVADEDYTDYYGYDADTYEGTYLFFRDSLIYSTDGINLYAGKYPYQGTVTYDEDDEVYILDATEYTVDEILDIYEDYIKYIAGDSVSFEIIDDYTETFYERTADEIEEMLDEDVYEFAIYLTGKISGVQDVSAANYFTKDSATYLVLSAINDLQFAFSTDSGILNSYYGYAIDEIRIDTSYVAEFEYAAQKLITNESGDYGMGSYCVVATDYGWHIIYVSNVYTGGEVYEDGFVYEDRNTVGTFSYNFYNTMKSSVTSDYTTEKQNMIIAKLEEDCVTLYERRYKDLTNLG